MRREFGLQVVVTSLDPLLVYVNPGVVTVRICSDEYMRNITADTPKSTHIVPEHGTWVKPEEWGELAMGLCISRIHQLSRLRQMLSNYEPGACVYRRRQYLL